MENFRGYHDQGVRWFVSSLVLIAAGCEYRYALDTISVQTEGGLGGGQLDEQRGGDDGWADEWWVDDGGVGDG
jgi:hypothetical protein